MNSNDQNPNPVPPHLPPVYPVPPRTARPLGDLEGDRVPVTGLAAVVESILREPRRIMYQLREPGAGSLILLMLFVALFCCAVYGLVVGTFSMGAQLWAAPAKLALGMFISALICLPSLYIFTCLSGSRARLVEMCGLLAGLLMLMTILLVGFAPVAWLFSQSTESVVWMGALHLIFWFIAAWFGLRFLQTGFSHSAARSNAGLHMWIIIFMLVAVQMTTALRPIVGTSKTFLPTEKKFFLSHWGDCLSAPAANRNRAAEPTAQ